MGAHQADHQLGDTQVGLWVAHRLYLGEQGLPQVVLDVGHGSGEGSDPPHLQDIDQARVVGDLGAEPAHTTGDQDGLTRICPVDPDYADQHFGDVVLLVQGFYQLDLGQQVFPGYHYICGSGGGDVGARGRGPGSGGGVGVVGGDSSVGAGVGANLTRGQAAQVSITIGGLGIGDVDVRQENVAGVRHGDGEVGIGAQIYRLLGRRLIDADGCTGGGDSYGH